ncbi:MAG: 2-amino-4-hydroxy-6-hydroxymethyldihydropteridine diphosphokinase [Actinobacteria bacterium]|nr:2-amino-4-hydroxy-6-hydroxymethyldihydropteridine diphosphokinase [Actinomycetota bacterium]
MFKIFVKNLTLYAYHGVKPEEKREGQYFIFNVQIRIKKESFKDRDNLCETVNYSEAIRIIKEINLKNKFDLMETLAEEIASGISKMSPIISSVKVKVEKINPPLDEKLDSVGVSYKLEVNKEAGFKPASEKNQHQVYLSVGTNEGNKLDNIRKALNLISKLGIVKILEVSSIYETEPMYYKNQNNFYNLVIKAAVKIDVSPFVLLGYLKNIEYEMGRKVQPVKNGPRIIDIDILYIEGLNINSDILKIPHPKLSERNFVIMPLSEVAPDFKINGLNIHDYISKNVFPDKIVKINQPS